MTNDGSTKTDALVPASPVSLSTQTAVVMDPQCPKHLLKDVEAKRALIVRVDEMTAGIKVNPADIRLSMHVSNLGKGGAVALLPHTELFEQKLSAVMKEATEGSSTQTSLIAIEVQLDTINPAVLRNTEMGFKQKAFVLFSRTVSRLPKGEEILNLIAERRETVMSTIKGIKSGLWSQKDLLLTNLADLFNIYEGLLAGHRLIEEDIYFAQELHVRVKEIVETLEVGSLERQNMEQFLADLTAAIVRLQTEENANMQFFAGTQQMANATRSQVSNIETYMSLMERAVLANLGLRVAAAQLAKSVAVTGQLRDAIGQTMVDTAGQIADSGEKAAMARAEAAINIDKLEEGCAILEAHFDKMALMNTEIIDKGTQTSRRLQELTGRMRAGGEGGHEGIIDQVGK